MKLSDLFEAGRVHTRQVPNRPAPRGAPEGWDKARAFDKKGEKNRSVLRKLHGDRNQFFATGDYEINPPDDEMSLPYHPGVDVVVFSGGEYDSKYNGISVHFPWNGGEPQGHTFDERAEKEWDKNSAKILKVARAEARQIMTDHFGAVDSMIDDDAAPALKAKVQERIKKRVDKMIGTD